MALFESTGALHKLLNDLWSKSAGVYLNYVDIPPYVDNIESMYVQFAPFFFINTQCPDVHNSII